MTDTTNHAYSPGAGHAEADPAAIDLVKRARDAAKILTRHPGEVYFGSQLYDDLATEVEALRVKADNAWNEAWDLAHEPARCGHVRANFKDPEFGTAEYRGHEKCEACVEVEALREQVAELEGKTDKQFYLHRAQKEQERAEASEAHATELAGTLEDFRDHVLCHAKVWEAEGYSHHHSIWLKVATALATLPAQALERARAKDDFEAICREFIRRVEAGEIRSRRTYAQCVNAFKNLDALDMKHRGERAQEFFGEPEGMATHERSDLIEDDALDQGDGT